MKNDRSNYLRRGKRKKPTIRQTKYLFSFCWELLENGTFSTAVLRTKRHAIHTHAYMSSRGFENIPQNGSEYSHRNLAIARFLVTAVRKNIGGLLSWLVSLVNLRNRTGEERRRQTLCDKRDNNFV